MTTPEQMRAVVAAIREAGGIVHSDGNIFFTNADKFLAAAQAAKAKPMHQLSDAMILHRWDAHVGPVDYPTADDKIAFARAILHEAQVSTARCDGAEEALPNAGATPNAEVGPAGGNLTDEEIIKRCEAAGIKWIEPFNDPIGDGDFPGSFDMVTMPEMRALLCGNGCAEQELGGAQCARQCEAGDGVTSREVTPTEERVLKRALLRSSSIVSTGKLVDADGVASTSTGADGGVTP